MSFEGYYQKLCANGHLTCVDVYQDEYMSYPCMCKEDDECTCRSEEPKCHCGAEYVHSNMVDQTNGIDEETGECPGYIRFEKIDEKICECCGTVLEQKYRLPKEQ